MGITYPGNCTTDRDKIEGLYAAWEKLRVLHNLVGKWHREGITAQERSVIAVKFPNLATIPDTILSESDWTQFLSKYFNLRNQKIGIEMNRLRDRMKQSILFNVDVTED